LTEYHITAKDTEFRLSSITPRDCAMGADPHPVRLCLHKGTQFQEHIGIGGAFTDAAAVNFG
jgi:hypothetical protein